MKKKIIIGAGALVALLIAFLIYRGSQKSDVSDVLAEVKQGEFKIEIESTGELEAKNSVKIQGPPSMYMFQVYDLTIQTIVDEGTVVKKGDWVATLDRSGFQTKYDTRKIELEKATSKFIQTQLDTTLQMRQSRDDLINLKYGVEEKQIILDQSKFEPPATIKQNEINLDKARRAYEQALENYKIKRKQNIEKMNEVSAELRKVQNEMNNMTKLINAFDVTAPEAGMVIYEKGWDGRAIKAGSQIGAWDPTVATLPDLTNMMSKTYVNEVDVRKIKAGQKVQIGLDAFPDKRLSGSVTRVANVGEQRPNSDAKVFEVMVGIEGTDPALRPSMTTSNKIVAQVLDSVLYVSLEALHSDNDSISYVFKKDGLDIIKQEVQIGETNANDAIIKLGLNKGDKVYLSVPVGQDDEEVLLLKELDGKRKKKEETKEAVPVPAPALSAIPTTSSN
jgi:HlyD family secretion protein